MEQMFDHHGFCELEIVDFCIGFISIMEHMFDHHGFCELEMVDFHVFYIDSGAIGRGHEEVEVNPSVAGTEQF